LEGAVGEALETADLAAPARVVAADVVAADIGCKRRRGGGPEEQGGIASLRAPGDCPSASIEQIK